jgi:hypothetical protein
MVTVFCFSTPRTLTENIRFGYRTPACGVCFQQLSQLPLSSPLYGLIVSLIVGAAAIAVVLRAFSPALGRQGLVYYGCYL